MIRIALLVKLQYVLQQQYIDRFFLTQHIYRNEPYRQQFLTCRWQVARSKFAISLIHYESSMTYFQWVFRSFSTMNVHSVCEWRNVILFETVKLDGLRNVASVLLQIECRIWQIAICLWQARHCSVFTFIFLHNTQHTTWHSDKICEPRHTQAQNSHTVEAVLLGFCFSLENWFWCVYLFRVKTYMRQWETHKVWLLSISFRPSVCLC